MTWSMCHSHRKHLWRDLLHCSWTALCTVKTVHRRRTEGCRGGKSSGHSKQTPGVKSFTHCLATLTSSSPQYNQKGIGKNTRNYWILWGETTTMIYFWSTYVFSTFNFLVAACCCLLIISISIVKQPNNFFPVYKIHHSPFCHSLHFYSCFLMLLI